MDGNKPKLAGNGLLGWLGRQVGYVRKAIATNPAGPVKLYEKTTVEQDPHPDDPSIILRRTVIDQAIAQKPTSKPDQLR